MTPQDKAKELVDKFGSKDLAKSAVEEIIHELEQLHKPEYTVFIIEDFTTMNGYEKLEYWQSVKTEIEKP